MPATRVSNERSTRPYSALMELRHSSRSPWHSSSRMISCRSGTAALAICLNCVVSASKLCRVAAICVGSVVGGLIDQVAPLLYKILQRVAQRRVKVVGGGAQANGFRHQLIDVVHVAHLAEQNRDLPEQAGVRRAAGLGTLTGRRGAFFLGRSSGKHFRHRLLQLVDLAGQAGARRFRARYACILSAARPRSFCRGPAHLAGHRAATAIPDASCHALRRFVCSDRRSAIASG